MILYYLSFLNNQEEIWGAPFSSENYKNAEVENQIHVKHILPLGYMKIEG